MRIEPPVRRITFMQQAMVGGASASGAQGGPQFDAALDDALSDAGKTVIETLKKPLPPQKK